MKSPIAGAYPVRSRRDHSGDGLVSNAALPGVRSRVARFALVAALPRVLREPAPRTASRSDPPDCARASDLERAGPARGGLRQRARRRAAVSVAWAATLLVLAALVVCAAASFFRNLQTGLVLLVGLPAVVLLHALLGTVNTLFLVAWLGILVALVCTIS